MKNSHIQWTDHTFNPWEGCTKVSPGCTHCYAEARNQRFSAGKNWGKGAPRRRTKTWGEPVKWNRDAIVDSFMRRHLQRPRVFCASLADWLDDEVPIEWLADLLKLIHDTPNLDWLLLTKRPENFFQRVGEVAEKWEVSCEIAVWWGKRGVEPANVWIGTTVEDQQRADERIPDLLKIPARVRFLSCEPMLERVDLDFTCFNGSDSFGTMPGISWVICGGESGHGARLFDVDWARSLRNQCNRAHVPFFMKQMGANVMGREMDKWVTRLSRKGGDESEWPMEFQIREFPHVNALTAVL